MTAAPPKSLSSVTRTPAFGVLYADPPWRLGGSGKGGPPYPCLSTGDICALPAGRLAAPDCALLLWAVHSRLPDALAVVRAWGFEYKTVAFTWVKRTPRDTGYFLGRGYWTHSNAEVFLLATRGGRRAPARACPAWWSRPGGSTPGSPTRCARGSCGSSGTCLGRSCSPGSGCPAGRHGETRSSATSTCERSPATGGTIISRGPQGDELPVPHHVTSKTEASETRCAALGDVIQSFCGGAISGFCFSISGVDGGGFYEIASINLLVPGPRRPGTCLERR